MRPYLALPVAFEEQEADRARALVMIEEGQQRDVEAALPLLDKVLETWPDDLPVLEAKARGLLQLGRLGEARDVCQTLLARAPRREKTLQIATMVAQARDDPDEVIELRRRLLEVNPRSLFHRVGLATALAKRGSWTEAREECERILRLYRPNLEARMLLVRYYLHEGDRDRARRTFDEVQTLKPPDADRLRHWFEEQLK